MKKKLNIGVIGLGYWGPNYVKNFIRHPKSYVSWVCDLEEANLCKIHHLYPDLKTSKDYHDLINDPHLDCLAIATPLGTHFTLAKAALGAGKHVFLAKPMTKNVREAKQLIKLAKKKNRFLLVDNTLLYSSAIGEIKKLISNGVIGQPLYYDSVRANFGLIRPDENVIWDLAPHEFSILDYCFGLMPKSVTVVASKHLGFNEEIAHIIISYSGKFVAHIHVSWFSPVKTRTIIIGGSQKMILFDDLKPLKKIKIYDKGVSFSREKNKSVHPVYWERKVTSPTIGNKEPLYAEVDEFIDRILNQGVIQQNTQRDFRVVKLLKACDESLKKGKPIFL